MSTPKKIGVWTVVLIAVFLLGYLPATINSQRAQVQKSDLEYKLRLAELRGQLGMCSYEANRNNFANAAQFTTEFFNGLRSIVDVTKDETLKQKLQAVLSRRDEITTNLAEANPVVKEKLSQMYADLYYTTTSGSPKTPGP
jgi:hypothetical protein